MEKYEYFIPVREVLFHPKLLQPKEVRILHFILGFGTDIVHAAKNFTNPLFIKVIKG